MLVSSLRVAPAILVGHMIKTSTDECALIYYPLHHTLWLSVVRCWRCIVVAIYARFRNASSEDRVVFPGSKVPPESPRYFTSTVPASPALPTLISLTLPMQCKTMHVYNVLTISSGLSQSFKDPATSLESPSIGRSEVLLITTSTIKAGHMYSDGLVHMVAPRQPIDGAQRLILHRNIHFTLASQGLADRDTNEHI